MRTLIIAQTSQVAKSECLYRILRTEEAGSLDLHQARDRTLVWR